MSKSVQGKCEICQILTSAKCSACENVFYCSKEHQKGDWKRHKKICKAYEVSIKTFGEPHPLYQCITVLRCLYLKENSPEKWQKLQVLQSHDKERQNTEKYENEKNSVTKLISKFFKLAEVFSPDEVLRICGIITVNAHEVPLSEPPYVAIYDISSLLEHNCSATCCKSFTSNGEILISSGKEVKKGEHFSICYADPLWGTQNRRQFLNETKFFWCNCQRCEDSTEFGSFFNAIKCTKKCNGYLLPKIFSQTETDSEENTWDCNNCTNSLTGYEVQNILQTIERDFSYLLPLEEDTSLVSYKKLIEKFEKVLHRNHYILTEVKFDLSQKIGQELGLKNVVTEDLEWKVSLCKSLDKLTQNIIPAEKRIRGLILFELHAALTVLGRRKSVSDKNPELFLDALLESKRVLEQAIELLKFEPDVLPEGKIYKQAVVNLRDIDMILCKIDS